MIPTYFNLFTIDKNEGGENLNLLVKMVESKCHSMDKITYEN